MEKKRHLLTPFAGQWNQSIACLPQALSPSVHSSWDRTLWGTQTRLRALVASVFVLALSRFIGLTHQSLWYDEGYTVTFASALNFHDFWQKFGAFTTSEHLQPLYYLLIFLWSRVAGASDVALRLPSAFFSIVSGLAAYYALSRVAVVRRSLALALFAAITVSSFSLYYAQEARPYALLQMLSFTLLAAWIKQRADRTTETSAFQGKLLLAIASSLCLLGSVFTALLVISLALADMLLSCDTKEWLQSWKLAILMSSGVYLTYLVPALATMPSFIARDVTAIKQPLWMNIGYALYGIFYGTTLPPETSLLRGSGKLQVVLMYWSTIVPSVLIMGMLVTGAVLLVSEAWQVRSRLSHTIRALTVCLVIYMVLLFGVFGAVGHLNVLPRHSSALFALMFLAVGLCSQLVSTSRSPVAKSLFGVGLVGWMAMNALSVYEYSTNPAFRKDDYRAAALVVRDYTNTPIFMVAGQTELLARYGIISDDVTSADPGNLAKYVRARAQAAADVTLIFNQYRNYRWDASTMSPIQAMAPDYVCTAIKHVANIDIYSCHDALR